MRLNEKSCDDILFSVRQRRYGTFSMQILWKQRMFVGCNRKCRYFSDFKGLNSALFAKREKEKIIKMGFGFHSGAIHVHVWKPRTLVGNFLVSCDSLVEPESQTVILKFFHVGTANISKAYSINCSYFATGVKNHDI